MPNFKFGKKPKRPIVTDDQKTESTSTSEMAFITKNEDDLNVLLDSTAEANAPKINCVPEESPMKPAITKKTKKTELLKQIESQTNEIEMLSSKIKELNNLIEKNKIKDFTGPAANFVIKKGEKLNKVGLRLKSEIDQLRAIELNHLKTIEALEYELEEAKKQSAEPIEFITPLDNLSTVSDIQTLQEKFSKTKSKLFDVLNQNTRLKNELKLAQKCIQQEIGDNVNLCTLVGSKTSGWRGREQKIISLQKKVADLKQKLEIATSSKKFIELPKASDVRQMNTYHRNECENLQSEIIKLRELIEFQKGKINALKAHKSVLSEDTSKYKEKLLLLLEKSENDDKYIKKLNEQLEAQTQQHELNIKDLYAKISEIDKLKYDLNLTNSKLLVNLENLEAESNEKSKSITELNEQVASLETDLRAVCGDFLFSCRDLTKDQFLSINTRLEGEKNDLLDFIKTLNSRSEESNAKLIVLQEENSRLKMLTGKLESKLRKWGNSSERMEPPRTIAVNSLASNSNSSTTLPACNLIDIEELRFNCETLNERIAFLEENLRETKYEKEMDWKIYTDIISKSKNIMIESFVKENKKT